jgi:hypothetical protein
MNTALTENTVNELVDGGENSRQHVSLKAVQKESESTLERIAKLLEYSYQLTYLEGLIHCDAYHASKKQLEKYGYINSFVRMDAGSLSFRFAYRRPSETLLIRRNIRPSQKGYSRTSFKHAASEEEKSLALETEEQYAKLRAQGKNIKMMLRRLRTIKTNYRG